MAGRNFPVVLLVGRNDIFADPVCFLMLTSFELVSYFVPSTGPWYLASPSLEKREKVRKKEESDKVCLGKKTTNAYQTRDSELIHILFNRWTPHDFIVCIFVSF